MSMLWYVAELHDEVDDERECLMEWGVSNHEAESYIARAQVNASPGIYALINEGQNALIIAPDPRGVKYSYTTTTDERFRFPDEEHALRLMEELRKQAPQKVFAVFSFEPASTTAQ
jgi:hypothetical protein